MSSRSLTVWHIWKMCQKYKTSRCVVLRPLTVWQESSGFLSDCIILPSVLCSSVIASCRLDTHLSKALTVGLLLKLTHAALWYFTSMTHRCSCFQSSTEENHCLFVWSSACSEGLIFNTSTSTLSFTSVQRKHFSGDVSVFKLTQRWFNRFMTM